MSARAGLRLGALLLAAALGLSTATVASAADTATSGTGASPAALGIRVRLAKKWGGFTEPLYVTGSGDGSGRLWVVEKRGVVKVISKGSTVSRPYLDVRSKVTHVGEQGLLGLAFAPDFKISGRFYVNYTDYHGDTRVVRFKASAPASNTPKITNLGTVIKIVQPYSNHNGGCIQFGPDGYLYVGMGDGGSHGDPGNRAQNPSQLLGKVLRIDTGDSPSSPSRPASYRVPADNPFVGVGGYRGEIWAMGVRNPWRFSFDRSTGDLWIGDVGQDTWEEVDFLPAGVGGQNLGWRVWEGSHPYPAGSNPSALGFTFPVAEYGHPDGTPADPSGGESVTGGYVYRGALYPSLTGTYFYGDFVTRRIWALRRTVTPGGATYANERVIGPSATMRISSFGQSDSGEIYLTDLRGGGVYRLQAY